MAFKKTYNTRSKTKQQVDNNTISSDEVYNRDNKSDDEFSEEIEKKDDEKLNNKKKKKENIAIKLLVGTLLKQAIDNNIMNEIKNTNKSNKESTSNSKKDEDNKDNDSDDDDNDDYDEDEDEDDDEDYEEEDYEEEDDHIIFLEEDEGKKGELIEKIDNANIPEDIKQILISNLENSHDFSKVQEWVNNVLKIPFNKYVQLPIDTSSNRDDIIDFFKKAKETLNDVVYGMDNVKEEIINYIAQFISNKNSKPRVLALQSSAGTGKTSIVRRGLGKILNRPIKCISMGGITDSSTFHGFDYTYVGSKYGIISRSIIDAGVMNPIIYMDELDKISETAAGQDIMNFLIHITDPEQSMMFEDKYFHSVPIDLSKVLFVFSFNDESRISPILLDRLNVVKVQSPSVKEKVVIAKDYILKDVCENIGVELNEIEITENAIRKIVSMSNTDGMRAIKRNLETIVMKINTLKLTGGAITFSFDIKPKIIEEEHMVRCLGKKRLKMSKIVHKYVYVVDEDKVSKLLTSNRDDTSYKMMFI
jgi:ATP-dependent Lon protease